MTTLHKAAAEGSLLTPEDIEIYREDTHDFDINALDSKGRTALCYAAWKGHVGVVKFLVGEGANVNKLGNGNRSALWYSAAGSMSQQNRLQIMTCLLGKGAAVDSQSEDGYTPLMKVIVNDPDPEIIGLLVNHGASTKVGKSIDGPGANDLARKTGNPKVIWALKHEPDCILCKGGRFFDIIGSMFLFIIAGGRSACSNGLIDMVIAAILAIIAVERIIPGDQQIAIPRVIDSLVKGAFEVGINRTAKNGGVDPKMDIEGKETDTEGAEPHIDGKHPDGGDPYGGDTDLNANFFRDLMNYMKGYLTETGQSELFNDKPEYLENVARRALELKDDPSHHLRTTDDIQKQSILALYQPVIYCDDSSSMKTDTRANDQRELVRRITRITTCFVPEGYGTSLQFINHERDLDDNLSLRDVERIMNGVNPRGSTPIGNGLRSKILQPLVYDRIQQPGDKLERPILISSITDGLPTREPRDTFQTEILGCIKHLRENLHNESAIKFQISQLGDDTGARDFLQSLENENELKGHLYCTTDRLDEKYRQLHDNEVDLERWLLNTLTAPLMEPLRNPHRF